MNGNRGLERYKGTLLLIAVVLVVMIVAWRGMHVAFSDSAETESSATTSTRSRLPVTTSADNDETNDDPSAAIPINLADVPVYTDDSLVPALNPNTYQGKLPQHDLQTYVVERGDTPGGIATQFDIAPETLLGGNEFLSSESSLLQVGVTLTILPIDGVLHDVRPGETLESISNKYGIPVDAIIAYGPNNLEFPYRVYPDTQIMVPGAVRELFVWTPPQLPAAGSSWWGSQAQPIVVGTGTFIYPVSARRFTQYYWYGHPGIDIASSEGASVYASDTGTVVYAGWNAYGYGNLVVINHGNGFETFYAHLSGFNVVPGQIVYQGNVVGYSGNTGQSSGPHIHFEIRLNGNRDDPCWYIGC
ncbi:MAG: M23 family metallopeptidase [Anaerolineae bacterium]|nr:M23 family metallopeptidase [Anaerolineae bacterium]